MQFLEEITATAGQLVKDLEQHLEKYPQIASAVVTSYIDDTLPITDVSEVDDCSKDCHGNRIGYICFAYDWKKREQGITVAKMLEILKKLDPNTGVLYDEGDGALGETDSGLRNLYPETDEDAMDEGVFICCYVEDDYVDIYCRPDDEEISCLSGFFPKERDEQI